jgi:GntR family transcriptional regulator
LIESRKGVGVFVCEPKQLLSESERGRRLDEAIEHFVNATLSLGFTSEEIHHRLRRELARVSRHTPTDLGSS